MRTEWMRPALASKSRKVFSDSENRSTQATNRF